VRLRLWPNNLRLPHETLASYLGALGIPIEPITAVIKRELTDMAQEAVSSRNYHAEAEMHTERGPDIRLSLQGFRTGDLDEGISALGHMAPKIAYASLRAHGVSVSEIELCVTDAKTPFVRDVFSGMRARTRTSLGMRDADALIHILVGGVPDGLRVQVVELIESI